MAGSMALLSTLSTAVDLVVARRERQLGRDPSEEQSPDVVIPSLLEGLVGLEDHVMALRASIVAGEREDRKGVELVRRLNDLILYSGAYRDLHAIHQRLMSLYPRVGEDLVEGTRRLHRTCESLIECEEARPVDVLTFLDKCSILIAEIRAATPQNRA